jgi:Methyltransferase domain
MQVLPTQDEWFNLVCQSYSSPPVVVDGVTLPKFPSDELQIQTTGQAGVPTLKEAFVFYQDCLSAFDDVGFPLARDGLLLDFGVGWGRIARFFLRELPLERIHGVDVMQSFLDVTRETFGSDKFFLTPSFPPTSLAQGAYSHIVGYSVFSHLSEQACMAWMKEFHRILVPGGIVAVTTRGRPFFDFCESLKGQGHEGYLAGLADMFVSFDEARARYDAGLVVHSNNDAVVGGGALTKDFYGETFIPEAYARHAYSEFFTLERFVFDPARQSHPIMVFKRKA